VAQPHATHAGGRDHKPVLPQFVGDTKLSECRLLEGERNDRVFDLLRHAVLQHAHFGDCERRFHAMVSAHFI
jgi:hypothetical protein